MRVFSAFCAVLCITLTTVAYFLFSNAPKAIRGEEKTISIEADGNIDLYSLDLQGFHFVDNTSAAVQLISVPSSEKARVEVTYSEDLDKYGFVVDISNNQITLSMESDAVHPIQSFLVKIYAPLSLVKVNGSGYALTVEGTFANLFSLYVSGDIKTDVSLSGNTNFVLASAGSSIVTVSGSAYNTHIALSGSTSAYAEELVCNSARVSIAGSGKTTLSILDSLSTMLKGDSFLEYWGSPQIIEQDIESTSTLTQISATIPTVSIN